MDAPVCHDERFVAIACALPVVSEKRGQKRYIGLCAMTGHFSGKGSFGFVSAWADFVWHASFIR